LFRSIARRCRRDGPGRTPRTGPARPADSRPGPVGHASVVGARRPEPDRGIVRISANKTPGAGRPDYRPARGSRTSTVTRRRQGRGSAGARPPPRARPPVRARRPPGRPVPVRARRPGPGTDRRGLTVSKVAGRAVAGPCCRVTVLSPRHSPFRPHLCPSGLTDTTLQVPLSSNFSTVEKPAGRGRLLRGRVPARHRFAKNNGFLYSHAPSTAAAIR
jgi:hypothetical protein